MMEQEKGETRIQYLARVLKEYMESADWIGEIEYDGAECDGYCLADDILIEAGCVEDNE